MKTILCVTDSAIVSLNSFRFVSEFVHLSDTRIILFHNVQCPSATNGNPICCKSHYELIDELDERNEYLVLLEKLKNELERNYPTATFDVRLRHGVPQETITELVQQERVDLVAFCNDEETTEQLRMTKQALAAETRLRTACEVLIVPPLEAYSNDKIYSLVTAV